MTGSAAIPRLKPSNTITVVANISSITTTELIAAPGSGKKIQIIGMSLYSKANNVITLKSATTAISPAWDFPAAGAGIGLSQNENSWMETAANEALNLTTTTENPVHVLIIYRLSSV